MAAFRQKVDPDEVPAYYRIIQEPMWLHEVKKKIRENKYDTIEQFQRDMNLIWKNAMIFNNENDLYHSFAKVARDRFAAKMEKLPYTPQEEWIYRLRKITKKFQILSRSFDRELDHSSTSYVEDVMSH
jgi:Asp-tRNA(Asn)/Glu-tRNA(Gln) amidotransferase B subunit